MELSKRLDQAFSILNFDYDFVSKEQIENIRHALGLNYKKIPFRNYFNTGFELDATWEDLCGKGLAQRRWTETAGYYYHVTREGRELIKENRDVFGLDKRLKNI